MKIVYTIPGFRFYTWFLLGVVFAFTYPPAWADSDPIESQPIIADISVQIEPVTGAGENLDLLPAQLIFLEKGQPFSPQRLQESIEALKMSRRFGQIEIDSSEDLGTMTLLFRLVPFKLIYDIHIRGEYPLFERDILDALTVKSGDPYVVTELKKQSELIETVFRRQGYMTPQVEITGQPRPDDGYIELIVAIDKGPFARLSQLSVHGNHAFSDSHIRDQFESWKTRRLPGTLSRFVEATYKSDLEVLEAFYRQQGFYRVKVNETHTQNPTDQTITADITIDEGPRYHIEFKGNDHLSDKALNKIILPFLSGHVGASTFKRALRELELHYLNTGFQKVRVTLENIENPPDQVSLQKVRFVIVEGPRTLVKNVTITGNREIPTEKILADVLTQAPDLFNSGAFSPATLNQDLATLQRLYQYNGFLAATIDKSLIFSTDARQVDVTLIINEGPQTTVAAVNFPPGLPISESKALAAIALKPGSAYRDYMLTSDQNTLEGLIADRGYPHVRVVCQPKISGDQHQVTLHYTIESGPLVTLGDIFFRGNFRTKRRIFNRALDLKSGQPFVLKKILEAQRTLRNMDALASVRFDTFGLTTQNSRVFVFAELVEKKPYFVEISGGYQSDTGFLLQVKTGDINLWGRNKSLEFGGHISEIGHRIELDFTEPRLLNHPARATLSAFWERETDFNQIFGTEVIGASLGVKRSYGSNLDLGLKLQYEHRDQFLQSGENVPDELDADEFEPRSLLIVTPALRYDTRDSVVRPSKGFLADAGIDITKGLENSLDDFLRYRLDAHYYFSPFKRLTLAAVARAGLISPYGNADSIPSDQLFYLGGTSDVRGFAENELQVDDTGDPVGGRRALSGSVEARIALFQNLELALFYDIGQISLIVNSDRSEHFRSSLGAGLRYVTAIGPIGIMYGHKLDRQPDESSGRFHFSIGYTF